jgi:glyceraldehyde 3-phosphate dehydrogenase
MAKIAINGMGRVGRAAFRMILDTPGLELTAVNDLTPAEDLAYLIRYDTVYGRFNKKVESDDDCLLADSGRYKVLSEKDPSRLPWKDLNIDIVLECTGVFTQREDLEKHIKAGAKKVILSAPSKSDDVATIIYGVNEPDASANIISCGSCTTNCITPVVEIMGRRIGVKKAMMTTIHAYTSSQNIVDGFNKKVRRGRAGASNLVPTTTGAAAATTKVLPEFKGKFDGVAIRAPIAAGSIADMVFLTSIETSREEVNRIFTEESESERYKGILGVTKEPLVSSDIIGDTRASLVDLSMTEVVDGDMVEIMSWYDNEWGYTSQMIREALRMSGKK